MSEPDPGEGVFGISVAAGLVGTGVQNLRAYERAGLLTPSRTVGGNRLYSQDDVARLRRIDALLREGLNLVGIGMVLSLEADLDRLREVDARSGRSPAPPAGRPAERERE
jgi:DNA-binding transcriptional MerR regulator